MSVAELVRQRIARGTMPLDIDRLLEVRGTMQAAAVDLAQFTGHDVAECLAALEAVYDPTH